MRNCALKRTNRCIWFTKENKDKLLKIEYPEDLIFKLNMKVMETDDYIMIISGTRRLPCCYYFNRWYVEEACEYGTTFIKYTDEEFNKKYTLL